MGLRDRRPHRAPHDLSRTINLPRLDMLARVGLRRSLARPYQLSWLRFQSNQPNTPLDYTPKKNLPTPGEWNQLKQHIPGETVQTNTLKDRVPMFPLGKENVPTLIPRPGVPRVGPQYTFRQVVDILKNKKQPELIYESEPHRLYFLTCFCCALVFAVYACVLLEYAWFQANKDYEENTTEKNEVLRKREWLFSLMKNASFGIIMAVAAFAVAKFPTRLIRRMWYLPAGKATNAAKGVSSTGAATTPEFVQFTAYPLFPGQATPVITVPLENLTRRHTARVWTGKGFYGTADNSFFFFVLKETGEHKRNWIVDRKGFFWSDGRVFDYLFGKELLAAAEAGIPYDEQVGIINREVAKKKKQLRKEHGPLWRLKMGANEAKADLDKAGSYVQGLRKPDQKRLGKGKS